MASSWVTTAVMLLLLCRRSRRGCRCRILFSFVVKQRQLVVDFLNCWVWIILKDCCLENV